MRHKNGHKQDAIIEATVKLVNKIGFVSTSVSKIAREANVSPATIYIYYRNKEDLLVSTYVQIKQRFSEAILDDFVPDRPIRETLKRFWTNAFRFTGKNPEFFQFTEQFSNSPFTSLVDKKEVEKYFEPMVQVLMRGIEKKIIKDVPIGILTVFILYPILVLSNSRLCQHSILNEESIEIAFSMAWDAISFDKKTVSAKESDQV